VDKRLIWLANIFNIPSSSLTIGSGGDVWVDHNFRLGYFSGNLFFRENPCTRVFWRQKIQVRESTVGLNSEPQYDLSISFTENGEIRSLSCNRTSMEQEYYQKQKEATK
jgi:hypothetical protein